MRREVAVALLLAVVAAPVTASLVKLVDNGYEDVVIAISPNIDESEGPDIIQALREMMKVASNHLFTATRQRLFFRKVKVVIPKSWKNISPDQAAKMENFQNSDIRVDEEHPLHRDKPYARQADKCGDPGSYIHLTPEYLTSDQSMRFWGIPGKSLVPLWAQLRWGVYDEIGYPNDKVYPLFYEVTDTNTNRKETLPYRPNYCADADIEGDRILSGATKGVGKWFCSKSVDNPNLPEPKCRFRPRAQQTAASSLMMYPFVIHDSLIEFCDSSTHNHFAPTKQNKKCKKSVWEVMEGHSDLSTSERFPNRALPPEEPQVILVQEVDPSYAIVMDYSGSMSTNDRMGNLQARAKRWLMHTAPTNSFVSLIKFSSSPATVMAKLTKITDQKSREDLANLIHMNNGGGTSVGSGLLKAIEELQGKDNKNILLITDGQENENPRISDVMDDVVNAGICVLTVAFGKDADPNLEVLGDKTGCNTYTVNDNDQTNMLDDAFEATLTRIPATAAHLTVVTIHTLPEHKTPELRVERSFSVDSSIGKNLIFYLETSTKDHVIGPPKLTGPNNNVHSASDFDDTSLLWTIKIPLAEVGEWKWEVELDGDASQWVKAYVTSQAREAGVHPITIDTEVSVPKGGASAVTDKIKLFAVVRRGNNPVVYAQVKAIITQPDKVDALPDEYDLLDNGLYADEVKNDGIYSGYMTKFSQAGRYSFQAEVKSTDKTVVINGQSQSSNASGRRRRRSLHERRERPDPCCGSVMPVDPATASPTGAFGRRAVGGSLKLTEVPAKDADVLPPAPVQDLYVSSLLLYSNKTRANFITLTWTTPGDDMDQGTVSKYTFVQSPNIRHLLEDQFNQDSQEMFRLTVVKDVEDANIFLPCGSQVNFTMEFKMDLDFDKMFYFGLRAEDESGNPSEVSNIAFFTIEEILEMPQWVPKRTQEIRKAIVDFKLNQYQLH